MSQTQGLAVILFTDLVASRALISHEQQKSFVIPDKIPHYRKMKNNGLKLIRRNEIIFSKQN
jgi:hypothetical protein